METRIPPMNQLTAEKVVTEMALLLQQAIVGYRFHPTEEELINYLKSKVTFCRETFCIIPMLENIYEINPWDLPAKFNEKSIIRSKDREWWFICPQTQNQRISRITPCGSSWKITGKHKDIKATNDDKKIGFKKILVFDDDRNSKGTRSNWAMHEFHPHPEITGFVLYWLMMKQEEKADNQVSSIREMRKQPNDAAIAMNGDFSSTPQFRCPKVSFSEVNEAISELSNKVYNKSDRSYQNGTKSLAPIQDDNHRSSSNLEPLTGAKSSCNKENSSGRELAVPDPRNEELNYPHPFYGFDVCSTTEAEQENINQQKANVAHSLKEKEDEMFGTSNLIGEQAYRSCDDMDFEYPEQLPFAEHYVQEKENELKELITNGSSSTTEISSRSGTTDTNQWHGTEPRMSPLDHDLFPNSELIDYYVLMGETEPDRGATEDRQLGETNCYNRRANKNQRPISDTLEGAIPLEEKIITECASSDGAPAKAKAARFKEKGTTMIQPQRKKDDVKIESDDISRRETWNDSLSPTRSAASTSCCCRDKAIIDLVVRLAELFVPVLLACVIVYGICRISDGVNQTKQHYASFGRAFRRF